MNILPLEHIQERYDRIFSGDSSVRLLIELRDTTVPNLDPWESFEDYRLYFQEQIAKLKPALSEDFESDWIPRLHLDHYAMAVLPSLFGCPVVDIPGSDPCPIPVEQSLEALVDHGIPDIYGGIMPKVEAALEYFIKNAPKDCYISPPPPLGPLDAVIMIRGGSQAYLEAAEKPELFYQFINLVADTFVQLLSYMKSITGEPMDHSVYPPGFSMPGLVLPQDTLLFLSRKMAENMVRPSLERIASAIGRVVPHFCVGKELQNFLDQAALGPSLLPDEYPSFPDMVTGFHVLDAFLNWPCVAGTFAVGNLDYFNLPRNPFIKRPGGVVIVGGGIWGEYSLERGKLREYFDRPYVRKTLLGKGRSIIILTHVPDTATARYLLDDWEEIVESIRNE